MTGPEHYREAERLIEQCEKVTVKDWVAENLAAAQVHATLALAAATAADLAHDVTARNLWHEAVQA